jgi:glycerol uptake facilitator-like aquaporin
MICPDASSSNAYYYTTGPIVIFGSMHERALKAFAVLAKGLCLVLIHLISIPVTNTSVNPARSTSQAIFAGGKVRASYGYSG